MQSIYINYDQYYTHTIKIIGKITDSSFAIPNPLINVNIIKNIDL